MINNKNGFTLLELLVVIGIIGILVALGTVAYSTTQRSGRDSRRKQDMVAIQSAMEQYYSENVYKYPNACDGTGMSSYIKSWPTDPDGIDPYTYTTNCSSSSYCVCAKMEKLGSGNANATSNPCVFGGTKDYYCVGNLQ